ncbi:MAG TPA: hypothetical protein VIL74_05350 [Pyrinomonadaceae bacterium]|jgi:hypothetical protein
MNLPRDTRKGLINWQKHRLFMPRFQMTVILFLTGMIGFLASFLLLRAGVGGMWIRYPLAILGAYSAFLLLLRLWLAMHRSWSAPDVQVDFPVGDGAGGSPGVDFYSGGDFGGGGAGGSWGDPVSHDSVSYSDGGSPILDNLPSVDLDLEELGLLIVAIAALIGGIAASLYVVYIAPVLLAEILVDGLLLGGLYRRVGRIERKHWLQTSVRKTLVPAILCAVFFGVAGGVLQRIAPEAESIGGVWKTLVDEAQ